MEVVKELNLNGNPQVVPNGSLVYAKNVKLSLDGTYITNDDGFELCFDTESEDTSEFREKLKVSNIVGTKVSELCPVIEYYTEPDSDTGDYITVRRNYSEQYIAGNINCPNEIVFFVHRNYVDKNADTEEVIGSGEESVIFRAVEFKTSNLFALFRVPSGWVYNGGTIIGTYTYNVYGHLIVGIAESDADIDKQLLTIDLNDSNSYDSLDRYSCAPDVPIANLTLNNKVKGKAMAHGLYYFYIRYEVSDKLYTSWFPIGAPQYALSLDYETLFDHTYATNDQGSNIKTTNGSFIVNTSKDSYYNFNFTINFSDTFSYIGFQIGYILQTDDTTIGRIWNNFAFNGELSKSFVFNGGYIEEVDIEDLTRDVLNIYNVKALTNYNNKLYAANFKETEYNVDLKSYADNINTYLIKKVVDIAETEKSYTNMVTWTYTIDGNSCSINVTADTPSVKLKDFDDLLSFLNDEIHWYGYAFGNENVLTYLGEDTRVVFSTDKLCLSPSLPDPYKPYEGSTLNLRRFWEQDEKYCFGSYFDGGLVRAWTIGDLEFNKVVISREEVTINYNSYNRDNVIRSLMPYEVYAFYVHYVRPDGSYTNGIPLENKAEIQEITLRTYNSSTNTYTIVTDEYGNPVKDKTYYTTLVRDLTSQQKNGIVVDLYNGNRAAFLKIITIDEIKDKYLYEFHIRNFAYAKEYFGVYLDNKGKKLFRTNSGVAKSNNVLYMLRLGVRFENITYPPGYVGAFFSYEKVNSLSIYQGYVSDQIANNNSILLKANDVEAANIRYDGTLFIPHHKIDNGSIRSISSQPYYSYINNAAPVLANASINFEGSKLSRAGLHGGIAMNLSERDDTIYQPDVGIVGSIIIFNRSIYSNEVKELIAFGPVCSKPINYNGIDVFGTYGEKSDAIAEVDIIDVTDTLINYDINYPSFLIQDKILTYKDSIFINEKGSVNTISNNIIHSDSYYTQADYASEIYVWKFSNVNLLALQFKKEPEEISGILANDSVTINTAVRPINSSDLFKLESCYIPQIHKVLTNYNKNLVSPEVYTNIIRCSYPIRNESGINSWRIFDPTKYYVIDNSNGEIVHIFGAGSSFFVHTKNNLLVTSSDGKITADNSIIHLQENNVFDIPPVEIFTSELGYGGLKYAECQLFSQFGYIWYDTDRRKLFRFDNGQLIDVNSGIDEIIKRYKFERCCINIDNNSNRIFFCFTNNDPTKTITIAYNTLNSKWLSIYDFEYDMSIHTANVVLFALRASYNIYSYQYYNPIYPYDRTYLCNYKMLQKVNEDFPNYIDSQSHSPVRYFCFDVIFNNAYTVPKVLDSITWVHELIQQHIINEEHPAEIKLEYNTIDSRVHDIDGLNIIVYSDAVDSGIIDLQHNNLNDVANPNNPNAYKYPYFDKGVWNLSYFRNAIITPVTDAELNALIAKYGQDTVNKLKKAYKAIDRNGVPVYRSSDMRSLIYGKYIVVRFIFKTTKRVKFDNIEFNLQKY